MQLYPCEGREESNTSCILIISKSEYSAVNQRIHADHSMLSIFALPSWGVCLHSLCIVQMVSW